MRDGFESRKRKAFQVCEVKLGALCYVHKNNWKIEDIPSQSPLLNLLPCSLEIYDTSVFCPWLLFFILPKQFHPFPPHIFVPFIYVNHSRICPPLS